MALPPPPAGLNLGETRVPEIFGALVTTWLVAIVAVGLRLYARRLQGTKFYMDDWLVGTTLIACTVHVWISIGYMVPHGTGLHVWAGPPEAAKVWAQGLLVSELAYTITMATVKLSTLYFYWRLFNTETSIHLPIFVMAAIVICWGIAIFLVSIFSCFPVHAAWARFDPVNPMPPSQFTCGVDNLKFFIGNSVPTIVTDAFIVAMPIPYVWKLQLRRSQKIALMGIFLLGAFVTIISAVRLKMITGVDLQSPDITWNFSNAIIWTNVEGNIAVICSCLPSLKPILNIILYGTATPSANAGSSGSRKLGPHSGQKGSDGDPTLVTFGRGGGRRLDDDGRPFAWLGDQSDHDIRTMHNGSDELSRIEMGVMSGKDMATDPRAAGKLSNLEQSITVTTQFEVKSTTDRHSAAEPKNAPKDSRFCNFQSR